MANLYVSMLDRLGAPVERFGDSTLGEVLKRLPGVTTGGRLGCDEPGPDRPPGAHVVDHLAGRLRLAGGGHGTHPAGARRASDRRRPKSSSPSLVM